MADPVTAMLVVGAATATARGYAQYGVSQSKLESLDLARKEHTLQHQQKSLANFETTQKILDAQVANATTRGIGLGSPSLEAIARNTANISAKRQNNLDIEESIFDRNVEVERENVNSTLWAELFGDVATTAVGFASVKAKMPSVA